MISPYAGDFNIFKIISLSIEFGKLNFLLESTKYFLNFPRAPKNNPITLMMIELRFVEVKEMSKSIISAKVK